MHPALALAAPHGLAAIAVLATVLGFAIFGTLAFTGTGLDAKDQNGGSLGAYVDQELAGTQIVSTAGPTAITITHGKVFVTYAGVAAMTLANPTPGSPAGGGNDAQPLKFIDVSGHAHTLTTGTNGINGNHHVATSGAGAGDELSLTAYNGAWMCNPAGTNWTIS
jgi:hypothetical protein